MNRVKKSIAIVTVFLLAQALEAANDTPLTVEQGQELMSIIKIVNHGFQKNMPYKATVIQKMLIEANYFSDRLRLPVVHPIQMSDIENQYTYISAPWYAILKDGKIRSMPATIFGTNICNTNILREQRLGALKFSVSGTFETTNFFFSFGEGKLWDVQRLSKPQVEYYANNLDALVGKPSLIDTNGAYQLATQWLAAVDMDMTALNKLKWTVSQLHYLAKGATNTITLPIFYVDFGSKHYTWPAGSSMKPYDQPLVSVEILGTTKELQELSIQDTSLSRRPLLLITNALDLLRTPNLQMKHLEQTPFLLRTN